MPYQNGFWDRLDLPGEAFPGQVLVEISGDNRVLIEHHQGVCEYSREQIGVRVKFGTVFIHGTGLELRCISKEQLIICGEIHDIQLIRRDKR